MKKIILSIAAIITLSVSGAAQSTPKKEAIKQLFVVMHQDSLMSKIMTQMSASMTASMSAQMKNLPTMDSTISSSSNNMMQKSLEASKAVMKKILDEDMVDVYDKYFSMQEIQDFITFYKSKSGQQLLNNTPNISSDLMQIMSTRYMPALRESMMKSFDEMKSSKQ